MEATATPAVRGHAGALVMGLGLLLAVLGPILYAVQFRAGKFFVPWYVPILSTIGLILIILALRQQLGAWRIVGFIFVAGLAGLEWAFLLFFSRLPQYSGPVVSGRPLPPFAAALASGAPLTQDNFKGEQATALVFFRGRW